MNGLVKTMDDGNGNKIKLVGNALTFILYKSYFGRDLLNDIVAFAKKSADAVTVSKFNALNIKTAEDLSALTEAQQADLLTAVGDYKFDSEFVLNFIAALIATARYPEKPDITDIIVEIPPHWVADKRVITELMEFLSLFITDKRRVPSDGNRGHL
jgi:hypothetical protein